MFDSIRTRVLRIFRVPHDPDPPAGAPGSARVFRAGRNFYKLRLVRWGFGQLAALAGILFSLTLLEDIQKAVEEVRIEVRQPLDAARPSVNPAPKTNDSSNVQAPGAPVPDAAARTGQNRSHVVIRRVAERWPWWLFPLLTIAEWLGVLVYVIQIPITYAMVRLDYELRWYIVTDRSLRIRAGLASVQETTMSFANIQHVVVTQGPLQRLLGIADLRVQSAGGGGDQHERGGADSLHTGIFHGVDNASQIRDLILDRLRAFRQTGLGDPDDVHLGEGTPPALATITSGSALTAARELLHEARALRQVLH